MTGGSLRPTPQYIREKIVPPHAGPVQPVRAQDRGRDMGRKKKPKHPAAGADDSTTHGPFDHLEFVDGAVYGQPARRLLARLEEQKHTWYSYEDKRSWPNLVVEKSS